MTTFSSFSELLRQRFEALSQHELYTVAITGDEVWAAYLAAFPEGANPIFRERTEHDCSCCRQFIRNLGNVVAIIDGKVRSIWSVDGEAPGPYNVVDGTLCRLIESRSIESLYRTTETKFGQLKSNELQADGGVKVWNHFHSSVPAKFQAANPAQVIGDFNTTVEVFHRGLNELTSGAFETVVGLIEANNLYRGEEFLGGVKQFQNALNLYNKQNDVDKELLVWMNATNPVARFRNTAIGTLLIDLSEGMELEAAVRSFEAKVAPTNYKRTTALITPRMIDDAMKTIDELGIREALERRFAKLGDISVNNVLWVDGSVQDKMKDGLAALLKESAVTAVGKVEATPISIADFMADVVPKADSISALVRNNLQKNLVSLTAPVHGDERALFKWDNNFAWSYNGNITDSIKEKVKAAGGNTDAPLRISLAWFNGDDLDIRVSAPGYDRVIYFAQPQNCLDVDMNAHVVRNAVDPVENVSFRVPRDGVYKIQVHNYCRRSTDNVGFVIELENNGQIQQFSHSKAVPNQALIEVGSVVVKNGAITDVKFSPDFTGGGVAQEKWGIKTEQYVKVETLMYSPNHWDEQRIGNRHWFFMLEGCLNDEPTRGIYNEFLDSALDKHRKVFEVLGAKTMCPPTAEQLSGLGFSSTKGESLQVQVTEGNRRNTYLINF